MRHIRRQRAGARIVRSFIAYRVHKAFKKHVVRRATAVKKIQKIFRKVAAERKFRRAAVFFDASKIQSFYRGARARRTVKLWCAPAVTTRAAMVAMARVSPRRQRRSLSRVAVSRRRSQRAFLGVAALPADRSRVVVVAAQPVRLGRDVPFPRDPVRPQQLAKLARP